MFNNTRVQTNPQSLDRKVVFVVEDDPLQCQELADYLRYKGVPVMEFGDGSTAIEAVSRWKPPLVLMDINMPECDGVEATKAMMAISPNSKVVLISYFLKDIVRANRSDCNSFTVINKPLPLKEIFQIVAGVLADDEQASAAGRTQDHPGRSH